MIDRRRNDLHTIRVLAEWDTLVENEHGHGPLKFRVGTRLPRRRLLPPRIIMRQLELRGGGGMTDRKKLTFEQRKARQALAKVQPSVKELRRRLARARKQSGAA